MAFIGKHKAKLDDKGRLVLPSEFKAVLAPDQVPHFVVRKDLNAPCLEMYTYEVWSKMAEQIRSQLNLFDEGDAQYWRWYMRGTAEVCADAKIGRITIPKELLDKIGVTKDVVFSGMDFKIEIWAKENFELGDMPETTVRDYNRKLTLSI